MAIKLKVSPRDIVIEIDDLGSIAEGVGILENEETSVGRIFALARRVGVDTQLTEPETTEATTATTEPPARRGRGPNKPKPVPEAIAPAPIPVAPPAPPAPPLPNAPPIVPGTPEGIPPFLQRSAPPAPVVRKLGPAIKAHLEAKVKEAPDTGQQWADWLGGSGITVPKSSFVEAMAVLEIASDEDVRAVAEAIGVRV